MTKVKICGLKRQEDIEFANRVKPDYVGFVFAKSSRQVDQHRAKKLIMALDPSIKKVGVFLNAPREEVIKIATHCQLDILQLHGDEDPTYCKGFDFPIWKAFRVKNKESLKELVNYKVDGVLLDTYVKGQYGGTGQTFNWGLVPAISNARFTILAGGLTTTNIVEAIVTANPTVVDVSGGVESNGVKDYEKMKVLIEKVRGLDG